jgi:hypothetical protein
VVKGVRERRIAVVSRLSLRVLNSVIIKRGNEGREERGAVRLGF